MSKDAPEFSPQKKSNDRGYNGSSLKKTGSSKIFKRKESNEGSHLRYSNLDPHKLTADNFPLR